MSHKSLTESETKIKRAVLILLNEGDREQNFNTDSVAYVGN